MIIDTFVCDYGGVVADHYSEPFQGELASALGVTRKRLRELLSERSEPGKLYRLDLMSKSEFWAEIMRLAGKSDLDEDYLQELWAKTYIPNQAVLSLLSYLKDSLGVLTGLILNEDRWRYQFIIDNYDITQYTPLVVPSFEVAAMKPDKIIYETVLAKSHRENMPGRVLYVDDRQTHVDAAKACGMQGYLHVNFGELSHFVETIDLVRYEP